MYQVLLFLHSWGRWAVLAGLLFGLGRAYRGWLGRQAFTPLDETVRHTVATVAHLQLTLGYLLYFTSPLVRAFRLRAAIHDPGALFFGGNRCCTTGSQFLRISTAGAVVKSVE